MLRHLRRQRESAPWSGERALIGRWSVCSSRCPLDHPQASPAHNDKRHSILPEGPACLSLPPSSPFALRFRRRFLSRGTVCYCMYHNARLFAGVSCVCIRVQFPLGSTTLVTPATALVAAQTLAIPTQHFTTNPTL